MRFNTFDEVVSRYERTKPVVGSVHKREDDIRPIGKRSRTWERIMKVDDNTYALLDGFWDNIPAMAPIIWTRTPDGDYIRLRSGVVNLSTPPTRYNLLHTYTPKNMWFRRNRNGVYFHVKTGQWTDGVTRFQYEDFPLPKCDVQYDATQNVVHDDNVFLTFRVNKDGTFTRIGTVLSQTPYIDRDLKKSLKPHIASFYEFCGVMTPMLDTTWGAISDYRTQLNGGQHTPPRYAVPVELAREIVSQDDHELRVALAALVIAWCNFKRVIHSESDLKSVKAKYNRTINKMLGLYTVETK